MILIQAKVNFLSPLGKSEVTDNIFIRLLATVFSLKGHFFLPFLSFLHSVHFLTHSSGSHIENWHSVLRNGLVNASYTKLQVRQHGSVAAAPDTSPLPTVNLLWGTIAVSG